jgi:ABC-type transporter Mla MlaB component
MAQGDAQPGLLSKVAKFVTNPTKDWSELGQSDGEQDGGYSKETLKVMIERKRQNDFVRTREFDHLRKLRRREPSSNPEGGGRPSFFQSSLTSNLDERAETLKKIDEIEAQMSRQWWKGKQDAAIARPSEFPTSPVVAKPAANAKDAGPVSSQRDSNFESTIASALRPTSQWLDSHHPSSQPQSSQSQSREMAPTVPAPLHLSQTPSRTANSRTLPSVPPVSRGPIGAGFSTNRLFAVELADSLTDPDLEEAAIRFANGDDAGAEEILLTALQGPTLRPESAEAWMSALFDLYRATGQQERFESVALEFASRFGRSAPAWFSTPDLLGHKDAVKSSEKSLARGGESLWQSPVALSDLALQELRGAMQGGNTSAPMQLDWQALESIQPDALAGLGSLFAGLCNAPLQLVFHGYDSLDRALKHITPSGDRGVAPSVWQMRMDALRVMRLQDEFELVALEYCVTFEVSPPSWQAARCNCVLEGSAYNSKIIAAEMEEDAKSGWGGSNSTMAVPADGEVPVVELTGEIVGDAADALARLEAGMEGATRMVISCARLIRVDFSAAGSILNWVAVQQGQGCQVQFRDVNRIVAAFFNVIGINEHARVVPRNA